MLYRSNEIIDEILQRNIFQLLESDWKEYKKEFWEKNLRNPVNTRSLLPDSIDYDIKMVVLRISSNSLEYKEIYENWDIVEVYELYSIKLANDYKDVGDG